MTRLRAFATSGPSLLPLADREALGLRRSHCSRLWRPIDIALSGVSNGGFLLVAAACGLSGENLGNLVIAMGAALMAVELQRHIVLAELGGRGSGGRQTATLSDLVGSLYAGVALAPILILATFTLTGRGDLALVVGLSCPTLMLQDRLRTLHLSLGPARLAVVSDVVWLASLLFVPFVAGSAQRLLMLWTSGASTGLACALGMSWRAGELSTNSPPIDVRSARRAAADYGLARGAERMFTLSLQPAAEVAALRMAQICCLPIGYIMPAARAGAALALREAWETGPEVYARSLARLVGRNLAGATGVACVSLSLTWWLRRGYLVSLAAALPATSLIASYLLAATCAVLFETVGMGLVAKGRLRLLVACRLLGVTVMAAGTMLGGERSAVTLMYWTSLGYVVGSVAATGSLWQHYGRRQADPNE